MMSQEIFEESLSLNGSHPVSYSLKALVIRHKKREPWGSLSVLIAESEGFKPPIPERGIPDFESSAIDHSANSPIKRMLMRWLD